MLERTMAKGVLCMDILRHDLEHGLQDQYLEITTALPPSALLYGLGESTMSTGLALARDGLPRALWTRDSAAAEPDTNSYGAHPFYLDLRPGV